MTFTFEIGNGVFVLGMFTLFAIVVIAFKDHN